MHTSTDCIVSIIVPVYNQEKYLEQCFRSILQQSCSEIELIAVNDGSTDSSGEIIKKWAATDSRVKPIEKENGGLSDARNRGIQAAKGEYLLFVDGDDWIAPDTVQILVDIAQKEQADMVIFNFYKYYSEGLEVLHSSNQDEVRILDNRETLRLLLQNDLLTFHVWRRLYRRVLTGQLVFPVGHNYEDVYATPILSLPCNKTVYIGKGLYYYRQNPQGISSTFSFQNKMDYLVSFEHSFQLLEKAYPSLEKEIALSREKHALVAWDNYLVVQLADKDQEKLILDKITEMIKKVPIRYLSLKRRFVNLAVIMRLPKPIGRLIYRYFVMR